MLTLSDVATRIVLALTVSKDIPSSVVDVRQSHPNFSMPPLGPWTYSPITFSNSYYQLLFDEKWNERKWDGPIQFENTKGKNLMMLMTDMALTTDPSFKKYAKRYAESEEEFFKDFSKAFAKLLELGVPSSHWSGPPMALGQHQEAK